MPFIHHINMGDTNACLAYIKKLADFGTNNSLIISPHSGGYNDSVFALDDDHDGNDYTYSALAISNSLAAVGVGATNIYYVNDSSDHIRSATNVAGYFSFAGHSSLGPSFPTNGTVNFTGQSSWFLISTYESFNGHRWDVFLSDYAKWFAVNAFGGTNYANTPAGAATHTYEPGPSGITDGETFFSLWAQGKTFSLCAWNASRTRYFMAVGDPFIRK